MAMWLSVLNVEQNTPGKNTERHIARTAVQRWTEGGAMIERIAAVIADLAENGITGAAGLSLILGLAIVILIFLVFRAKMNNTEED
jgi:hypothetical protein